MKLEKWEREDSPEKRRRERERARKNLLDSFKSKNPISRICRDDKPLARSLFSTFCRRESIDPRIRRAITQIFTNICSAVSTRSREINALSRFEPKLAGTFAD
ncbi:hypothetical protein PUN28_005101 [Cardiocondyla obscurior]|uniref:Uncharacterized protein n=1 Tax=Cardiocondyla obscurior TaxID=286306 RepID=A0AAW2GGZ1_9HYME